MRRHGRSIRKPPESPAWGRSASNSPHLDSRSYWSAILITGRLIATIIASHTSTQSCSFPSAPKMRRYCALKRARPTLSTVSVPRTTTCLPKRSRAPRSQLADLGPSLEYNFVVFNLNDLGGKKLDAVARKQAWFRDLKFRQAINTAVDRDGIVRLVYGARGTPLWGNVGPGNKLWVNQAIPHPKRSVDAARQLLKAAGFSWNKSGQLLDASGQAVEFTIITSSSNAQRMKMATLLQDDLSHLGMQVHVVPLEFRAVVDRVFQSLDYDAAIMGLGGGDADPNPEMNVWMSNGTSHLWNLGEKQAATDWEREIDQLMQQQMVTLDYAKRKKMYDRVQQLISNNLPFIFLATPNILAGADARVGNFMPAVLDPYTLWNADELYIRSAGMENAGVR